VALANLFPAQRGRDELDSFMYQTVAHEGICAIAECMDLPLFRAPIRAATSLNQELEYRTTEGDEVEELFRLLAHVKAAMPEVDAVASGAILSNYQRTRVEAVAMRLGLVSLALLWQGDQRALLDEMVDSGVEAVLVKVACMGLTPRQHLGKSLAEMRATLHRLNDEFGAHVCGEGGEYETFTLDCPLYHRRGPRPMPLAATAGAEGAGPLSGAARGQEDRGGAVGDERGGGRRRGARGKPPPRPPAPPRQAGPPRAGRPRPPPPAFRPPPRPC
jgi:diphthine-ammonia ligase